MSNSAPEIPLQTAAEHLPEARLHVVHFYPDHGSVNGEVSRLAATELVGGNAVVLITTKARREQLERDLRALGLDTAPAFQEGRFRTLDAHDTLEALRAGGAPSRARFMELVGNIVTQAAANSHRDSHRVLVFAELADLLIASGNLNAALRLEELWDELAQTHSLSLHCAYPISPLANEQNESFVRRCAERSGMIKYDNGEAIEPGIRLQPETLLNAESLEMGKGRLRLLTDAAHEHGVMMLDAEGCIISWSKGAETITGFESAEVIGKHFSRLYSPEDLISGEPRRHLEAAEQKGIFEEEGLRVRKDGSAFWARVTIFSFRDASGAFRGYGEIIRDFTEPKRAQMALHHSEERFQLLVEAVQDYAIFILDPEGYVSSWNIGAERMKGYLASEIIGRHFSVFYSDEERKSGRPQRLLRLALQNGRVEDEGWRVRKDGSKFWANVTITPIKDHSGILVGFGKVTRDVTERMQAARSLRESEARYRTVAETALDAIVSIDQDNRIQFANSATSRIFGYDHPELLGQPLAMLLPRGLRDLYIAGIQHYRASGERRMGWYGVEFTGLRKNGEEFPAEISLGEVAQDGQRLFIGFIRDITERKRAAEKLAESERSLRHLSWHLLRTQDEERRRIGRELHDSLGQYLSALKITLDGIGYSTTPGSEIARQVDECCRLAEASIKEVRTISYLMYPPMLEEMGLKSVIPWYIDGFSKRSGIETTFDISADFERLPLDVELALFRVLQESLTNVHRHSGSSVAIVRLFVRQGMAILEVADRGKGLSSQNLENGAQDWMGSLGVGLRGMGERMKQLGGQLEISSTPKGTTITAIVPCQVSDATSSAA